MIEIKVNKTISNVWDLIKHCELRDDMAEMAQDIDNMGNLDRLLNYFEACNMDGDDIWNFFLDYGDADEVAELLESEGF